MTEAFHDVLGRSVFLSKERNRNMQNGLSSGAPGNILTALDTLCEYAADRKKELQQELAGCPEGKLYIKTDGGRFKCYHKTCGVEKSCSRRDSRTIELARKHIAENELEDIETCRYEIEKALSKIKRKRSGSGTDKTQRIKQIFGGRRMDLSEMDRKWLEEKTPTMESYSDSLIYRTSSGLMVRSKSERTIADCLDEYGIIYKYEAPVILGSGVFYPDFTILKRSHQKILWEHFGLMDNSDYFQKTMHKIEMYRREGFVQHTNLICTYEEDIRSENTIRQIIESRLLI